MPTTRKEITAFVHSEIDELLGFEVGEFTNDAAIQEDFGADSLDITELQFAVEDEFEIDITDEEIVKVRTVGDLIDLVASKVEVIAE